MFKLLFALAAFAFASSASAAADLTLEDILGRWCGNVTNYTFTPTQLSVIRLDGKKLTNGPVLQIAKVEVSAAQIDVHWLPEAPGNFTRFELSRDKNQLIQVRETKGDKEPRRVFNRC